MEPLQSDQKPTNQNLPKPSKQNNANILEIIGFVLVIIVGVSAFYLGKLTNKPSDIVNTTNFNPNRPTSASVVPSNLVTQAPSASDSGNSYPIIDGCNKSGCLFEDKSNSTVIGFASLSGYYTTYSKKDWGDVDVTCDALVVTSGNTKLIGNLMAWIKQGNSINKLNDKGELVLNINLKSLSENIQQKIKSSSVSSLINLDVIRILPVGRGASACTSFVDIITVN